jgi:hemerythrin-like domain-containing protein
MDVIELLSHDHRMVEQLFRDYHAAANDKQRRAVVEVMVRELSKHAALEELSLYPVARRTLEDGADYVVERLATHAEIKRALGELDRLTAGDARSDELMNRLRQEVEEHVRQDEDELLPALRDALDAGTLTELGGELDQAKRHAPTRPHPHAPDTPPLLTAAAPVAAAYDRLRDRIQHRPRT